MVPQAQLIWSEWNGDDFTDGSGNMVNFQSHDSLVGRIGVAYEHENTEGTFFGGQKSGSRHSGYREKIYVVGNILHQFSGNSTVNVNGSTLVQSNKDTWIELGVGGSIVWGDNNTLFAEGSYRKSIANTGGDAHGFGVSAGLRTVW